MENDNFHDRSVIGGLTISELDEYSTPNWSNVREQTREAHVTSLDPEEEGEIYHGKRASRATSLFMLRSVHVKPKRNSSSSSLFSVYGEITGFSGSSSYKSEYLYKRDSQDVEIFSGSDGGGYLTLNGPSSSCFSLDAHFLFRSRKLSIRLYDQQGKPLYPLVDDDDDPIIFDHSRDDFFEEVKEKVVENSEISLTFKYVSIPMAVYGCLHLGIFKRKGYQNVSKFVDLRGKVVAKYKNTLGNYESEEIVLFDKNPEYERFVFAPGNNNILSSSGCRCWLAAPAYSSLQLHIDLFDCQQGTSLIEDVELETGSSWRSYTQFVFGQYLLDVCAMWCSPPSRPWPEKDGRDVGISRTLTACTPQLSPSAAIEVFSVLVFCDNERCTSLRIHGRLQFSFDRTGKFCEDGVDIFNYKQEEELPLYSRGGRGGHILVWDGSRFLDSFFPLSVVCDLKDAKGGLNIEGHQILNDLECFDTKLCSIFRGDHGFAALHYAIFPSAVQAYLKVFVCKQSILPRLVDGIIRVRYKGFDYSSKYKKNWHKILVFVGPERNRALYNFSIPLTRSLFVVPLYSSLIFELNLKVGGEKIVEEIEFAIGRRTRKIKREACELKFVIEWSEVK